jgi:hypothetical protein
MFEIHISTMPDWTVYYMAEREGNTIRSVVPMWKEVATGRMIDLSDVALSRVRSSLHHSDKGIIMRIQNLPDHELKLALSKRPGVVVAMYDGKQVSSIELQMSGPASITCREAVIHFRGSAYPPRRITVM